MKAVQHRSQDTLLFSTLLYCKRMYAADIRPGNVAFFHLLDLVLYNVDIIKAVLLSFSHPEWIVISGLLWKYEVVLITQKTTGVKLNFF